MCICPAPHAHSALGHESVSHGYGRLVWKYSASCPSQTYETDSVTLDYILYSTLRLGWPRTSLESATILCTGFLKHMTEKQRPIDQVDEISGPTPH